MNRPRRQIPELKWAMIAAIAGSIAALAGTVQSYVSWRGKDDVLNATVLSVAASRCSDVVIASRSFMNVLTRYVIFSKTHDIKKLKADLEVFEKKLKDADFPNHLPEDLRAELESFDRASKELTETFEPIASEFKTASNRFKDEVIGWNFFVATIRPELISEINAAANVANAEADKIGSAEFASLDRDSQLTQFNKVVSALGKFDEEIDSSCTKMLHRP
jgi:hypothetical protein